MQRLLQMKPVVQLLLMMKMLLFPLVMQQLLLLKNSQLPCQRLVVPRACPECRRVPSGVPLSTVRDCRSATDSKGTGRSRTAGAASTS
jgi:hypothetical protein